MHAVSNPPGILRNRLREARARLRLTQRDLAARASVSHQTIVWLENDDSHVVTSRVMLALWDALNVPWSWLWYPERAA